MKITFKIRFYNFFREINLFALSEEAKMYFCMKSIFRKNSQNQIFYFFRETNFVILMNRNCPNKAFFVKSIYFLLSNFFRQDDFSSRNYSNWFFFVKPIFICFWLQNILTRNELKLITLSILLKLVIGSSVVEACGHIWSTSLKMFDFKNEG